MIDVGGPSLLRGAAKNFAHVAPVCRPGDYDAVLDELRREGSLSDETRRRLAATAFATTAAYEAAIAAWFADREPFPDVFVPVFEKQRDLAYGENPHQGAAYYAERGARTHLLARVDQLHGRELSFNNLNDLNAARLLVREFTLPGVRDRQARESLRRRGRRLDRGGVRVCARRRPRVGLRRRCRPQPAGQRRARPPARGAVRRGALRPRLRPGRGRGARPEARHADPQRPRAPRGRARRARFQARPRRRARPEPRLGRRRPRGDGGRVRRADGGGLGRPALRLACVQARRLERDRAREGSADDRRRGRSDEPGRRGPPRRREGPRARALPRRGGRWPRTRSSRSRTGRSSPWTPA